MDTKQQLFRIWSGDKMFYPCNPKYDTSILFNESGWEVFSHFTGKPKMLVSSINEKAKIMEYIGILDRYGNLIFESDIVKINGGHEYEVIWDQNNARWMLISAKREGDEFGVYTHSIINGLVYTKPEVIGNIYENINLLK